jgi:hypothetical protein
MQKMLIKNGLILIIICFFITANITPFISAEGKKQNYPKLHKSYSVFGQGFKGWSIVELVSTESTSDSGLPSLFVDNMGTVHVAWADTTDYGGSDCDTDIFYKSKPAGEEWTTTEVVSTESTGGSWYPSLYVDSDYTVHIAWEDETFYSGGIYRDIFYKYKPAGGSWTAVDIVNTGISRLPSLAVDSNGTVHVAWHEESSCLGNRGIRDIFYKSKTPGGSWSAAELVSTESTDNSYSASLSVDHLGTVHVTWHDLTNYNGCGGDRDIFYKSRLSGGDWTTTEVVSTESTSASWSPSLAVDSNATVHVAWYDYTSYIGGISNIFYKSKPAGEGWTTTEVVSTESTYSCSTPSLAVDHNNTVHVVWEDSNFGGSGCDTDIFYRYKPAEGSWGTMEIVTMESTGESLDPSLFVDYIGTVHVAWAGIADYGDSDEDWDIFYKYKNENLNQPPNKPSRPTGPAQGKAGNTYLYHTSTVDPNGLQVYYLWDWGDGSYSDWLGPFTSGVEASASHMWDEDGAYMIRVKAKNTFEIESQWSDPLPVKMPYPYSNPFIKSLNKLTEQFPKIS